MTDQPASPSKPKHKITPERRAYLRDYQRRWIAERKAAYFAGKACADCGAVEGLQLDHIDPTQKIHHAIWSWSDERRQAELSKCEPRCLPCHQAKTRRQGQELAAAQNGGHGSAWGYRRMKCKCDECVNWNRQRVRDQRAGVKRPIKKSHR